MRALLMAAALLAGCGGGEGELRVAEDRAAGELGYVRCLAAPAPAARSWSVGALRLALEGRRLTIAGLPAPARLAAVAGPLDPASLQALRGAHLTLVLGELGDTREELSANLAALAGLDVPVLVVAGGAERHGLLQAAFSALEGAARDRVIDASVLRAVRIGAVELVPLAGAPLGRYASTDGSCGFGERDVEDVAEGLGAAPDGVTRALVSWAGPSSARGLDGVEAGSALVARLATRVGARAIVFAWPDELAGGVEREPLRVIVRPLSGPSGRPGAVHLTVGAGGLAVQDDSP